MNLQYAYYEAGGSGQTAEFSGASTSTGRHDYYAAGAFDGSAGLPADGTPINDPRTFEAYVQDIEHKTTEISSAGLDLTLDTIAAQYVVLGGTGNDHVTAASTTVADGLMWGRSGDDTLTGGSGHNTLLGGGGSDTLISDGSGDKLIGGSGADTIEFTDFIAYQAGRVGALGVGDTLDFSGAAQSFGVSSFKEVSHFDGGNAEVEAVYHPHHDDTAFLFDVNNDGIPDAKVIVRGGDYSDYAHIDGVSPSAVTPDAAITAPLQDHHALVV